MLTKVTIYSDGACRDNPGPGGWGVLLIHGDYRKTLKGAVKHTTNNRMELQAAVEALSALKYTCRVQMYTDSRYVLNGITEWVAKWKRSNWLTSAREPVKNQDLWQLLDELQSQHRVNWHWVKAHSGVAGNERADALANAAIDKMLARS